MMFRRALFGGCVLLATSCAPPVPWQGKWLGHREVSPRPGADPTVVETMSRVELTVKDGSFELIQEGIPRSGPFRTSGKSATLVTAAIAGREPPRPVEDATLTYNDDGTITLLDPTVPDEPVTLHRVEQ